MINIIIFSRSIFLIVGFAWHELHVIYYVYSVV